MIAKISWVQEHRTAEHTIVNNAVKKAKELPDEDDDRIAIIGHVPEIIATIEYEGYDTNLIRGQLGFGTDHTAVERNRRCRVIISRYLRPITELEGDDLLAAFLQCVLCELFSPDHSEDLANQLQLKVTAPCGSSASIIEISANAI
ncbi:hypothetical protein FRB95_003523 [Tulasnella sp. JGI-2019a]|nr:hypothetical protein FRB95_003523 [Tulasnella sp. JGI-2019a]